MSELLFHTNNVLKFMREIDSNITKYSIIFVIEGKNLKYHNNLWDLRIKDLIEFKDYEKIFDELLNKGYSWINLNCMGVLDGCLVLCVELPHSVGNTPREKVQVNYSGPCIIDDKLVWNLRDYYNIVE